MSVIASILYPVDFSPSCVAMAAYVKRAAALLGAKVSLVHVVDPTGYNGLQLYVRPISEVSDLPIQLDLREEVLSGARLEARRRIAELQQMVGTDVPIRVAVGSVKEALLEAALEADADVLMIGRSHQPGAHGRMRDLTYAMVRDSPFPVLSVCEGFVSC